MECFVIFVMTWCYCFATESKAHNVINHFILTIMNKENLYKDSVIEVIIITNIENNSLKSIALKYLNPENYLDKNGDEVIVTNVMGGETDWFILPHTFGIAVGKKLFEQYSLGLEGFEKSGIKNLKEWLLEFEIIDDAMCY